MATVTFMNLMERLAVASGINPSGTAGTADWSETNKYAFVSHLNAALEWCWRPENPRLAWPETIGTGTVAVTSGVIAWNTLGAGDWFNLWTEDPRPQLDGNGQRNPARAVQALWDAAGVYPRALEPGTATVFAFYRTAIPQGTWSAGSSYATPTVPSRFARMVVQYANAKRLLAGDKIERSYAAEREALKLYEDELSAFLDTDVRMPWMTNAMAQ
jgi:hypothetical protein